MGKEKVLYVSQSVMPYMAESIESAINRQLPTYTQDHGRDIRLFMPRFCTINERKHQLHEVIRLSGMNIVINNCDRQLIIKVGSIPGARLQVYFIDNEEYFSNHPGFSDEQGHFYTNNDERLLFFGKGTLEAVKKLAWSPNLIHFSGWFTSLIPFYLRRINKDTAFFAGTKTVVSINDDAFVGMINPEIERKLKSDKATAKDLTLLQNLDYLNLMKAAITYANGIVIASPTANAELVAFAKENKKNVVDYNEDRATFFAQINKMYDAL